MSIAFSPNMVLAPWPLQNGVCQCDARAPIPVQKILVLKTALEMALKMALKMARGKGTIQVLRSLDLWKKGCVKSRAFLLRRDASSPPPSARVHALRFP